MLEFEPIKLPVVVKKMYVDCVGGVPVNGTSRQDSLNDSAAIECPVSSIVKTSFTRPFFCRELQ